MSKKLNVDLIQSELEGSAFFRRPIPSSVSEPVQSRPVDRPSVRPGARDTDRPIAPGKQRRTLVRVAFEFWDDQVDRLRKRSLQDKLEGGKGSMSEWVREAVDEWFAKHGETKA